MFPFATGLALLAVVPWTRTVEHAPLMPSNPEELIVVSVQNPRRSWTRMLV